MFATQCSECQAQVRINTSTGVVTATVASNGKRGQGHVPAHEAHTDAVFVLEDDLVEWECPVCGYADSDERPANGWPA